MTTTFDVLIGLTLVVAVADWIAVGTDRRRAEYVLKPLTMVVLIGAALAADPVSSGAARGTGADSTPSCEPVAT